MRVKFWGVRGSIASAIQGKDIYQKIEKVLTLASPSDILSKESIRLFLESLNFSTKSTYGGNTACLEFRDSDEKLIIIDGGTGLRELGNKILKQGFLQGTGTAQWLFSHSHWDHIQGMPFFIPLYIPGNIFNIHSTMPDLKDRLSYQHDAKHFPVPFEGFKAVQNFFLHSIGESYFLTEKVQVTSKAVRHPGGNVSYKFQEGDKTFIYATDAEFNLEEIEFIDEYIHFFQDADVIVFDTQYTFEESLQRIDWGHSSASIATDLALRAGVKKLVMFHHDPSYNDEKLDAVFIKALKYKEMLDKNNTLEIIMAYEGLEMVI